MAQGFTDQERSSLLRRRQEALAAYRLAMTKSREHAPSTTGEAEALAQADAHLATVLELEEEYFLRLPNAVLSICPLCDQPLVRTFDSHGLDGLWWRASAAPEEPIACRHFCVLTGALDFAGRPVRGGDFEAHVGPEVPFVIPRLLAYPQTVAAVSEISMANGYRAFTIAYFAERRPPPQDLTAPWCRDNYLYRTQLGEVRWRIPNEVYDFDLKPWLASGRLKWTAEKGGKRRLVTDASEPCPFVALPGERSTSIVRGEQRWQAPAFPRGSVVSPFEMTSGQ